VTNDAPIEYPEDRMMSLKREEVRIFDHYHQKLLQQCQIIRPDRPIIPYIYTQDLAFWQQKRRKRLTRDFISFSLSLLKFTEFLAMWYLDAQLLASVGMLNWAFFWLAGVTLQILGLSRENEGPGNPKTTLDLIQGEIPSVQVPGQRRKVLLGVPLSVRQTWPWRIV
jgi:hypothetical protein